MKDIITIILLYLFFINSLFSQNENTLYTDSVVDPYNLSVVQVTVKHIIFNNNISEFNSYIDNLGNLIIRDSSNFEIFKSDKDTIKVLSKYPNIFLIKNNVYYFIDLKMNSSTINYNNLLTDDDLEYLHYDSEDSPSIQYYLQMNNSGIPELIINWHAHLNLTNSINRFKGFKVIDLNSFTCLVDYLYFNAIDQPSYISDNAKIPSFTKKIIITDSSINVQKFTLIPWNNFYYNITNVPNKLYPGIYKFQNGKFRLQNNGK